MLRKHGIDEGCQDLYFWNRKKRVVHELAPQGVKKFSEAIGDFKNIREREVQLLDEVSIESEDQKTHWKIEEFLLQRGSILVLESTILFYDKLFPRKFVAHEIVRIQDDVIRQKEKYTRSINLLDEESQRLLAFV